MILVLAVALVLELAGGVVLHRWQDRELIDDAAIAALAVRVAAAADAAEALSRDRRVASMRARSDAAVALNWVPATVLTDASAAVAPLAGLRRRLIVATPDVTPARWSLTLLPGAGGRRDVMGALAVPDGSFVTFRTGPFLVAPPTLGATLVLHLLLLAAVLVLALLALRMLVRPLEELAAAADEVGRGRTVPVPATGPAEVRRVAAAFDAMQARLLRLVEDHAEALAAVSHDLRTPITRMRLRVGQAADPRLEAAMEADLKEMESFIASVLRYVGDEPEDPARLVDLGALLACVADDAADLGVAIDYCGPDTLPAVIRPLVVKRMVGNLVDNARAHARTVHLSLEDLGDAVRIAVDDDGPGIAPAARAAAVLPFRRLDPAPGHAGAGLGLAIVTRSAAALGGALALETSTAGGLRAAVTLPVQAPTAPSVPSPSNRPA